MAGDLPQGYQLCCWYVGWSNSSCINSPTVAVGAHLAHSSSSFLCGTPCTTAVVGASAFHSSVLIYSWRSGEAPEHNQWAALRHRSCLGFEASFPLSQLSHHRDATQLAAGRSWHPPQRHSGIRFSCTAYPFKVWDLLLSRCRHVSCIPYGLCNSL